eukprot:TRINITY_DN7888_c0_g2_i1.p1 TRINITY_DN7888_c0_g2~~TRINITY_DN7888_c0_g2_i1.p1  ORF type:complete len:247 (-),score=43.63 TRINITY_DN7888_c0_g2_i1:1389-2129(-)
MQLANEPDTAQDILCQLNYQANNSQRYSGFVADFGNLLNYRDNLQQKYDNNHEEIQQLSEENQDLKKKLEDLRSEAKEGFIAEEYEQRSNLLYKQTSSTLLEHAEVLQDLVKGRFQIEGKAKFNASLAERVDNSYAKNKILYEKVDSLKQQLAEKELIREAHIKDLQLHIEQLETAEDWAQELREAKRNLERKMVELADEIAIKRSSLNEELDVVWHLQVELQSVERQVKGKKLKEKIRKAQAIKE